MNRRNFFKRLGLLAGLFIIDPLSLLKEEKELSKEIWPENHGWVSSKELSQIDYDFKRPFTRFEMGFNSALEIKPGDLVLIDFNSLACSSMKTSPCVGRCVEVYEEQEGIYRIGVMKE